MEPRRVLMTGARGRIGSVLRPALRTSLDELRLSDRGAIDDLVAPETSAAAELTDFDAILRAVEGVDAVIHLGAVADEAPFAQLAGPNLHGAYHVFEACRRWAVKRVVYASSSHATGMYPVGVPLDGSYPPRPDGLYGASKVFGEALGRMYADRFGLSVVCLRIGAFGARPREKRELSTWLSHADAVRLFRAALTADVAFGVVYGGSKNTRRWWPPDTEIGFAPVDDAEVYAGELAGEDYAVQGGPHARPEHGGWTA